MRIVVERSQFLKSLNHVQSVVERRNTIPILSNILLQAKAESKVPLGIGGTSAARQQRGTSTRMPACSRTIDGAFWW